MYSPSYKITNNLLKYIGRIEACKEVIANAPLVPAWEAKFRDDARVRTIHHGTHLEGNDLTKEQAGALIRVGGTNPEQVSEAAGITAKERDIQEIINYRNVMAWIDDWGTLPNPRIEYTELILKQLHRLTTDRILEPEKVGEYRKAQVVIRSVEDGKVIFRPPVHTEITSLIAELMKWLNSEDGRDVHSIIRAGIAHYELVRIHPFIEGNGRTSRAFCLLMMYAEGFEIQKLFSIEEYFDRDIEGYYRALASVQAAGNDMTYWLEYFCFGLAVELDRVKQQVLKLSSDAQLKNTLGGVQVALSDRQIAILELLRQKRTAVTGDFARILPMISTDTILRDLKDMLKKGIIKKEGVTKGVIYFIRE